MEDHTFKLYNWYQISQNVSYKGAISCGKILQYLTNDAKYSKCSCYYSFSKTISSQ